MKYNVDSAEQIMNHLLSRKEARILAITKKGDRATDKERQFIDEEKKLIEVVRYLVYQHKNMNMGKVPPTAQDLEQAILGAIMLESREEVTRVLQILKPEHFYSEAHQQIYTIIRDLYTLKAPIDMLTVIHEVRRKGLTELLGGTYYIAELTSKVSSAANIEYHARVVIEYAIKRFLIMVAGRITIEAYDDTTDVFELLEAVEGRIQLIKTENIKPIETNA
jgi:replicative DNA helicase